MVRWSESRRRNQVDIQKCDLSRKQRKCKALTGAKGTGVSNVNKAGLRTEGSRLCWEASVFPLSGKGNHKEILSDSHVSRRTGQN